MGHYTQLSILESATLTTFVYLLDTESVAQCKYVTPSHRTHRTARTARN